MPPHPRLQQVIRNAPPQMGRGLIIEAGLAMECLPTLECGTVEMIDTSRHEGAEREDMGRQNAF